MNKKLLLVGVLALGMLASCGEKPASEVSQEASQEASQEVSQEQSQEASQEASQEVSQEASQEQSQEASQAGAKTFGESGYYLVGTATEWSSISWTYGNWERFKFTEVVGQDEVYELVGSISEDDIAAAKAGVDKDWKYKVRYYDNTGSFEGWYPDGVGNDGVISEAGEYKFTFNKKSEAQGTKEDGEKYTLYTTVERLGDAKEENALKLDYNTHVAGLDPVKGAFTLRVRALNGEIPEGEKLWLYSWEKAFIDGWAAFEIDEAYSTETEKVYKLEFEEITKGLGPLSQTYGFCLAIAENETVDNADWSKKIANPDDPEEGNYSITIAPTDNRKVIDVDLLDRVTMSPEDLAKSDLADGAEVYVKGKVSEVSLNEESGKYLVKFDKGEAALNVEAYEATLKEGEPAPTVGQELSVKGVLASFEGVKQIQNGLLYRVAYDYLYVKGDHNGWGNTADAKLVLQQDGSFAATVTLEEGKSFKVANAGWSVEIKDEAFVLDASATGKLVAPAGTANGSVVESGRYTFTYRDGVVTVSK